MYSVLWIIWSLEILLLLFSLFSAVAYGGFIIGVFFNVEGLKFSVGMILQYG